MKATMISVIGDVIIDVNIHGETTRLSPEAPVPIVKFVKKTTTKGGAGNVYENIKSLTNDVVLCTKSLNDNYPLKQRVYSGKHYITRIDYEDGNHEWDSDISQAQKSDYVIVSDYNKGAVTPKLLDKLKGLKVIIDPKRKLDFYIGAWCLKPNLSEFQSYTGPFEWHRLQDVMKLVRSELHVEHLIVTLSDKGVAYYGPTGYMHIPSEVVDVSDVTGAGDTFTAVLVYQLSLGASIRSAIKLANKAAGIACQHHGTYIITKQDLGNSQKTVFTNGCFDVIHTGHIEVLKRSRELGDRLVVGLNSDASVKRLKGKDRPVNDEQSRKLILESFSFVDEVIIFDEDTPHELIRRLQPDVITKGGDYDLKNVVGSDIAEVVILPFKEGFSSTNIINRIKAK